MIIYAEPRILVYVFCRLQALLLTNSVREQEIHFFESYCLQFASYRLSGTDLDL